MTAKIKDRLKPLLMSVYYRCIKLYTKQILKCSRKNHSILLYILLEDFREAYKNEDIDFRINLVSAVLDRLLPFFFSQKQDSGGDNEIFISYETERLINIPEISRYRLNHFLLEAFFYSYVNKEKSRQAIGKAKEIDESAEPLTTKSFDKLRKVISRENRLRTKIFKQNLKAEREKKKISKRRQVDISINEVKTIFGIASILFLLSGYIYNHLFLGYFGIEVSKFFTLNDYIATSIDKIYYTVIGLLAGLILMFFWWSPEYIESRGRMSKYSLFFEDVPIYLFFLSLPIISVIYTYLDMPGKYHFVGLTIFFVLQYFIVKFFRFFKRPFLFHILISYLLLFFVFIISDSLEAREDIFKYNQNTQGKYVVSFKENIQVQPESLSLLSSNSNYSFFYSHKERKSYVIQNRNIRTIERKNIPVKGFFSRWREFITLLLKSKSKGDRDT